MDEQASAVYYPQRRDIIVAQTLNVLPGLDNTVIAAKGRDYAVVRQISSKTYMWEHGRTAPDVGSKRFLDAGLLMTRMYGPEDVVAVLTERAAEAERLASEHIALYSVP